MKIYKTMRQNHKRASDQELVLQLFFSQALLIILYNNIIYRL